MKHRSVKQWMQTIHLWVGLVLCLPIVAIGLSGSALLLQREILEASVPSAPARGQFKSLSDMVDAAIAAPGFTEMSATRITIPSSEGAPASVRMRAEEAEIDVFVDPVSLAILGSEEVIERGPLLAFFITLHAYLFLPPHIGLPFVGAMGFVMVFMALSGLVLWWPRRRHWRQAFWMRPRLKGLAFHLELHRVAGIWGMLLLLALGSSGIYLSFPQSFSNVVGLGLDIGLPNTEIPEPSPDISGPINADDAVSIAAETIANARPSLVFLARQPVPYVVQLEASNGPSAPPISVMIDPETARVEYIDDPRDYPTGSKFLNMQHAVHFGIGFGWIWAVLVFVSGLLPLLFAITGTYAWWLKRRARRALERRASA